MEIVPDRQAAASSRVLLCLALLTSNAIAAFSEECDRNTCYTRMLGMRSRTLQAPLTWNAIAAFSEECDRNTCYTKTLGMRSRTVQAPLIF